MKVRNISGEQAIYVLILTEEIKKMWSATYSKQFKVKMSLLSSMENYILITYTASFIK